MPVQRDIVGDVVRRLAAAGCVAPEEEAAELLRSAPDPATLATWLSRREQGEPIAWIVGRSDFCGLCLQIDPGVYVPRAQSEELARRAARLLPPLGRAVDLCTGAGAIAAHLSAMAPAATVVGVDIDPLAAACARRNGVRAVVADLDLPIRCPGGVDVVTAVAPYVPSDAIAFLPRDVQRYEPRHALDGGGGGLDVVTRVVESASRLLRPGGWLLIEVGGEQDELLRPLLTGHAFRDVASWRDEEGDLRMLVAQAGAPPASIAEPGGAPVG